MRILYLSPIVPWPLDQGDRIRAYNLIRRLGARHQITLVCVVRGAPAQVDLEPLRDCCEQVLLFQIPPVAAYLGAMAGLMRGWPLSVGANYSRAVSHHVEQAVQGEPFDAVIAYQARMAPYAAACAAPIRAMDLTDALSLYFRRSLPLQRGWLRRVLFWLESKFMRRFEQDILKCFDRLFVSSGADLNTLLTSSVSLHRKKSHIVPNGVDLAYFQPHIGQPGTADVVFTGNMAYLPNEDAVLFFCHDVLPELSMRVPNIRVWLVGKNPTQRVLELAQNPHVTVTGEVPDVRPYLARAAVVISPVRMGAGTRLKILEAMAAGKAVVTTSIGCEGLDVVPGRDLVVADDPQEFAAAVAELLANPLRAVELGRMARSCVEQRYSWDAIANACEAALSRDRGLSS